MIDGQPWWVAIVVLAVNAAISAIAAAKAEKARTIAAKLKADAEEKHDLLLALNEKMDKFLEWKDG